MREIKFRAWLKEEKRFYDLDITDSSCVWVLNVNYDYILNQYIWLKDKNGTPIYEGDILSHRDTDKGEWYIIIDWIWKDMYPHHCCDYNDFIYTVLYSESHSWLGGQTKEDIEVIWNIYENKELLNNK